MKIPLLALGAVTLFGLLGSTPSARAQYYRDREVIVERDRGDFRRHARERSVFIIEDNRPVRRTVFVDERGRYFRIIDGQPVIIGERVFEEYPSRYYFRDGRPRAGITLRIN
ncbi:MAG: hypothetical protein JO117_06790 [Verrucomicrobia bacterium]|nr:hypothetical protein [Verrucomicrobiota bacterium]